MPQQVALILVGLIAGVFSGMFGIGGGLVIVPALVAILGFDLKEAVGTSLAALLLPVGIFAVLAYYRAGKLNIKTAAFIGTGVILGALAGAIIALNLPTKTLQQLYGVFLLYMSWRFVEPRKLWAQYRGLAAALNQPDSAEIKTPVYILILIGAVAGVLSGMFGIGGGIVIVPALVAFLNFEQKLAVGTSLAVLLMPVSLLAVISYYEDGQLNPGVAALVAIGLVFGSIVGARLALRMQSTTIKRMYGVFLLFVGLNFILRVN
jgi:uncharacterized membrane protein YfcA